MKHYLELKWIGEILGSDWTKEKKLDEIKQVIYGMEI